MAALRRSEQDALTEKRYPGMLIKANTYRSGTEIIPCPFCGEKEEIFLESYDTKVGLRWRILCSNCMCTIDRGYDQQPGELIKLWNFRKIWRE